MAEQANISSSELRALQLGIAEGVNAAIAVAQSAIVQMLLRKDPAAQGMAGFVQAVQENRAQFEGNVLGLALLSHFAPADAGEEKIQ